MATAGRKAKKVTIDELIEVLAKKKCIEKWNNNTDDESWHVYLEGFNSKIEADLGKIHFDLENTAMDNKRYNTKCPLGFHTVNGLSFLLCIGGGDWERGVAFVLYLDPKGNVRGYVPKEGNVYNFKEGCAYGSEGEYPRPDGTYMDDDEELEDVDWDTLPDFNFDKLVADICERISVED